MDDQAQRNNDDRRKLGRSQATSTRPSKSQQKREAQTLTGLGERLAALPPRQLDQVPLNPELKLAIDTVRSVRRGSARRRALLYVAKLLRGQDTSPIAAALASFDASKIASKQRLHELERLRSDLMEQANGAANSALETLLARYPHIDRQHMRQLIRNARREQDGAGPAKASRELFRYLRDVLAAAN